MQHPAASTESTRGPDTKLIVIRGSAGSGKTTMARAIRERVSEPVALVERDYFQRTVLNQIDAGPHPETADLIDQVIEFSLQRGFHVVLDGTLNAVTYRATLEKLYLEYPGRTTFFAFDLAFEETLRRHGTRAAASEFGEAEMREWFRGWQPLGFVAEERITAGESVATIVERIGKASGLLPL